LPDIGIIRSGYKPSAHEKSSHVSDLPYAGRVFADSRFLFNWLIMGDFVHFLKGFFVPFTPGVF